MKKNILLACILLGITSCIGDIKSGQAPSDVQAVDLGLSVKWASCNVGAESPEDYGNYYAWGEVSPKKKYSWKTYKYANGDDHELTKYCSNTDYGNNGFTDNKNMLDLEDDAAHVNWGGNWRMPTLEEWIELSEECTWIFTTLNGVTTGYQVTSKKNENFIFLPAAGSCEYFFRHCDPSPGSASYWSASLDKSESDKAGRFGLNAIMRMGNGGFRCFGCSVRPVCK